MARAYIIYTFAAVLLQQRRQLLELAAGQAAGQRLRRLAAGGIGHSLAHLQQQAAMKVPRRHVELYDTIMGCLGYTSPDGGINENNNWCRWKK